MYLTFAGDHSLRLPGNNAEKNEDLARDRRKFYSERVVYYADDDVAATSHLLDSRKTLKEF
jgi:hypothetical protein